MTEPFDINRRAALARMGAGMGTLGLFNSLQAGNGDGSTFCAAGKKGDSFIHEWRAVWAGFFGPETGVEKV